MWRALRPLTLAAPTALFAAPRAACDEAAAPKRTRKTVYVIRHGEAAHNVAEKSGTELFARRRDTELRDPALTALGIRQAVAAREVLGSQLAAKGDAPGAIVSSTLRRALETAELAARPAAPDAQLLALDLACEIQFWDIWNEPLDGYSVATAWPQWTVETVDFWRGCGEPPLESADRFLARVEALWARVDALDAPVVVLVAHGCLLWFLVNRLKVAGGQRCELHFDYPGNGEVQRVELPPLDGLCMNWEEVADLGGLPRNNFFGRYQKRVDAIYKADSGGGQPTWAQREWRFPTDDEDFVPEG